MFHLDSESPVHSFSQTLQSKLKSRSFVTNVKDVKCCKHNIHYISKDL